MSKYNRTNTTFNAKSVLTFLMLLSSFPLSYSDCFTSEWGKSRLSGQLFTHSVGTSLAPRLSLDKWWLSFSSKKNKKVQETVILSLYFEITLWMCRAQPLKIGVHVSTWCKQKWDTFWQIIAKEWGFQPFFIDADNFFRLSIWQEKNICHLLTCYLHQSGAM